MLTMYRTGSVFVFVRANFCIMLLQSPRLFAFRPPCRLFSPPDGLAFARKLRESIPCVSRSTQLTSVLLVNQGTLIIIRSKPRNGERRSHSQKTEDSKSDAVVSTFVVLYRPHNMSTPNNRSRPLGQADSTDNASRSAIKLYEIYRR